MNLPDKLATLALALALACVCKQTVKLTGVGAGRRGVYRAFPLVLRLHHVVHLIGKASHKQNAQKSDQGV